MNKGVCVTKQEGLFHSRAHMHEERNTHTHLHARTRLLLADIVGDCYIVVAGLIKEDQDGFVFMEEMDDGEVGCV